MYLDQPNESDQEQIVRVRRKDLLAARRLLRALLGEEHQSSGELLFRAAGEPANIEQRSVLIARAQDEFQNRRRRGGIFAQSMFGEAAWDMLIALYIRDMSGQRQTVGGLMQFSGAPTTTAKRWLDFLVTHDLVRRDPHPTDQRTAFVSLTGKAREKLDLYYSGTVTTAVSTVTHS